MPPDRTSTSVSRRGFLRDTCLLGAMMAVGAPLAAALSACDGGSPDGGSPDGGSPDGGPPGDGVTVSGNTITLDLTRPGASALAAAGGFLYLASADTVAVNVDGTTVRAFSSVCPHAGNPVSRFSGGELVCPSHDSHFSPSTGARVSGPAPTGLQAYAVTRSGDVVTITKA